MAQSNAPVCDFCKSPYCIRLLNNILFDPTIVNSIKQGLIASEVNIREATNILLQQQNVLEKISEQDSNPNPKGKSKHSSKTRKGKLEAFH